MNSTIVHKEVSTITKKMNIKYNSYTYLFEMDKAVFGNAGAMSRDIIENNNGEKRIESWFGDFLRKFGKEFNRSDLEIQFTSTAHEIRTVKEIIASILKEDDFKDWKIAFSGNAVAEKDVLGGLYNLIEKMEAIGDKDLINKLKENGVFAKKNEIRSKEVSVVVCATMSAGKSTFVNALLGKDLLPSKNMACTATICKIKDIDGKENFDAKVYDFDDNHVASEKNVNRSFLDKYNEAGNVKDLKIILEGDIKNISSKDVQMVLIDTPGPNNSQSSKHKEVTYDYIKDQDNNPLILYVMNATQLQTDSDKSVLMEISTFINNKGSKAEERIVFILNRIDDIKKSDGTVSEVIEKYKKYLAKDFDIKNPRIFPLSAEFAKLSILNETNVLEDDEEIDSFEHLKRKMVERGNIDVIKDAPISQVQKDILYKEAENDKYKASLHYSGITAIQMYINEYVNTTSKIIFSHELIKTLEPALSEVINDHEMRYSKSLEDIKVLKKELDMLTPYFTSQFVKKKEEIEEKINAVGAKNSVFEKLILEVDRKKNLYIKNSGQNSKANKREAEVFIKQLNDELANLEVSIKTTIKSEQDYIVKNEKEKIETLLRNGFSELISNANLSSFSNDMLINSIKIYINNSASNMISNATRVVTEVVGEEKISTSSWWNPFSWGSYKIEEKTEDREYVNLSTIYNNYVPIFTQLSNRIIDVDKDFENTLKAIKNEGVERIGEIKAKLDTYKKELDTKTKRAELSEKDKIEKEKVLNESIILAEILKTLKN